MSDDVALDRESLTDGASSDVTAGERLRRERDSRRRARAIASAAIAIAAAAGVALVANRGAEEPEDLAPTPSESAAPPAVSPVDLSEIGWFLEQRWVGPYGVIDAMSCAESKELAALTGYDVIREIHRAARGDVAFAQVTQVRYRDEVEAQSRVEPITDPACSGQPDQPWEVFEPDVGESRVRAAGYRHAGSVRMTFVGPDGLATIAWLANSTDRRLIDGLASAIIHVLETSTLDQLDTDRLVNGHPTAAIVGCGDDQDVVTMRDVDSSGPSRPQALAAAVANISGRQPSNRPPLPTDGWTILFPGAVEFLDRGDGVEALVRYELTRLPSDTRASGEPVPMSSRPEFIEEWRVVELAFCGAPE